MAELKLELSRFVDFITLVSTAANAVAELKQCERPELRRQRGGVSTAANAVAELKPNGVGTASRSRRVSTAANAVAELKPADGSRVVRDRHVSTAANAVAELKRVAGGWVFPCHIRGFHGR